MLRSMYSGISGMSVNQIKLDVIGNNIANVGTTSFKASRARFSDMLSQNFSNAMSPGNNKGGVNASQVGLGVQLASIDTVMSQGMMQPTGRPLDVAIDGAGFFMVSKGPVINGGGVAVKNAVGGDHTIADGALATANTEVMYSRDGAFTLDKEGNLLTGAGYRVMGYSLRSAAAPAATDLQSINEDPVTKKGVINFIDGTKDLVASDSELKTLKIPDKVTKVDPADATKNKELRVKEYTIDGVGVINAVLEDGSVAAVGQIAMAGFKNQEGLVKLGGNLYSGSVNSGDPVLKSGKGNIANDNSKAFGFNLQGMLEMANVDLAAQFTDMIIASRAFQASGKMITTGDEILQDIINLKR